MADKETEQIKKLNQTVHSKDTRERDQAYNDYVKQVTPTHDLIFNMVKAFFTGGIICCIGQFILNTCENYGLDKDTSGGWCSMLLILLSVILTGFNITIRSHFTTFSTEPDLETSAYRRFWLLIIRSIFRLASRFAISSRLSYSFLPRAMPISSLAMPFSLR